jgi:cytochrome c peroxidase
MKKKIALALFALVILGLALPVYNLFVPLPANKLTGYVAEAPLRDVAAILAEKCVVCHSLDAPMPFYAMFPVAKQLMAHDVATGAKHVNLSREILELTPGTVSEATLAKIEYTTERNSMPPAQYLIMHWNHLLTAAEKEAIFGWIQAERAKRYAVAGVEPELQKQAIRPLPEKIETNPAKVALGDKLYHDGRLSKDNTISCASCHDLAKGGTDQAQFSTGVAGQVGDINAPTVFNAAFNILQFWDGRAANLEAQADGPPNNPIEMASNWEEIAGKLSQDAEFTQAFTAVYPDGYKKENFVNAIAEYERTLLTPAAFDKYLRGDQGALSAEQKQGYQVFKELGCATCHSGVILGGASFEVMGLRADYYKDRGNPHTPDFGRFNVTKNEADRFRLKVPTLRNIEVTHPYFHDGSTSDLGKAVETMAKYQSGVALSARDRDLVVAFLESLTGEHEGKKLQ